MSSTSNRNRSEEHHRHRDRKSSRSPDRRRKRSRSRDRGSGHGEREGGGGGWRRSGGRDRSRERGRADDRPRNKRRREDEEAAITLPPQDWKKDGEGFWSRRLKRVAYNPHLNQLSQNELRVNHENQLPRVLTAESPRLPYRRRRGERKSTVHWGQRKLLLSEIEFLTQFSEPGITVVYAGAAPGTHTAYLAALFPEVSQFVLVDPSPFKCQPSDRIVVRQEYFTADVARDFVDKRTLLISDVRTAQWRHMDTEEIEKAIAQDMSWQREWHELMCPKAGMYKFRLPWKAGLTEYLDGEVRLPVWGPQTTTEARLISQGGVKQWDNTMYEEQMFYYNTVTRLTAYDHDVEADGLDHCCDCASEVHVLRRYLQKYAHLWLAEGERPPEGSEVPRDRMRAEISKMIDRISRECSPSGRNLRTFLQAPDERKEAVWFKSAQFDATGGKLVEVQHKQENMDKAARMTAANVMRDALGAGVDASRAVWTDLSEPTLGDLSYTEATRGVEGLGDDVPPRSFLYRWVLCVALSAAMGTEASEKLCDVTSFKESLVEEMLGPLLREAAAAAGGTAVDSTASGSGALGVLVLSCKSGTVYLVQPNKSKEQALPAVVTRLMLPLPSPASGDDDDGGGGAQPPVMLYHHLTVLKGILRFIKEKEGTSSSTRECSLTLTDLWALQGKATAQQASAERAGLLQSHVAAPLDAMRPQLDGVYRRSGIQLVKCVQRKEEKEGEGVVP